MVEVVDQVARATVVATLKAVTDRDRELFAQVFKSWDDACSTLLEIWAREASSGLWVVFSEEESFGMDRADVPRTLLASLVGLHGARSTLSARVAIENFLES